MLPVGQGSSPLSSMFTSGSMFPQPQQTSQQSPIVVSPSAKRNLIATEAESSFSTPKSSTRNVRSGKRPLLTKTVTATGESSPKYRKVSHGPTLTPKSKNSRTGWVPLLVKMNSKIQIKIMVQNSNGKKGPFTSAGPNSKLRPSWDSILGCEYQTETKPGGVKKSEFLCTSSDNDKHKFRADLIDPFMTSTDPFTQKMSEMVLNNPKLLGYYISLLSTSKNFFNYSEKYEANGFLKDGNGVTIDLLNEAGGNIEEFEAFILLAEKNYVVIGNAGCDDAKTRSKKITDYYNPKLSVKKMSKQEIVDKNFREEIQSDVGLEKSLVSQYVDFSLVPIDRLQVSPQLFLKINQSRVEELASSMADRFDPSAVVLMVSPENFEEFEETGESAVYNVIHGTHRLSALKLLDDKGILSKLPGLVGKKIPCYLIKTATASLANYCNIRSNDLSADFKSKASIHELIFVYIGLLKSSKDPDQSLEVIIKICYTRHVPQEDISAIQKISRWKESSLEKLAVVLEKFQKYSTLDASSKRDRAKIRRRETKSMTKTMFRQLGRCEEEYFEENYDKVISNTISLQTLVNQSEKVLLLQKTERNAVLAAGVDNPEELKAKYPSRFDKEVIENFVGAEVYGKKANKQGDLLKSYVKSVKSGTNFDSPVKLNLCENILEISSEVIDSFDSLVIIANNVPESYISYLINHVGSSYPSRESRSIILVLNCEYDLLKVLNCLECWRDKTDFNVSLCFFEKENGKVSDQKVKENVTFAVIFGKVNVYKGELKTANKPIETELKKIVDQISPPNAKIAYVSLGNSPVIQLHNGDDLSRQVTYITNRNVMEKLKKNYLVRVLSKESDSQIQHNSNSRKTSDVDSTNAVDEDGEDSIEDEDGEDSVDDEESSSQDDDDNADTYEENEDLDQINDHHLEKCASTSSR